ncbi:pilin N-terminal domain-containing protein [Peptoniphilus raoultii]|uniref:pilin N-terminal domain-containing protein n=1 Tax=Peptoniphilus raoultii TaxID=1776387 RepID=UPI0009F6C6B1|nr:pilin N-terminal domain-containing protein [Peptoniphilus raoultii]
MKNKVISMLLAFAMIFSILALPLTALAQNDRGDDQREKTTGSVTLHKMLLKEKGAAEYFGKEGKQEGFKEVDGKRIKYTGEQITDIGNYFGEGASEIAGVYFVWQRWTAADNVDKNSAEEQKKDANWSYINVDGDEIERNPGESEADYTKRALAQTDIMGKKTETGGAVFQTQGFTGLYRILEVKEKSTYKGNVDGKETSLTGMYAVPVILTLPLVNEKGVVTDAHVYPKNTEDAPKIDKNFKGNTAEATDTEIKYDQNQRVKDTVSRKIGDVVEYVVQTEIPKDADYKFLTWNDSMMDGLTYKKDLVISGKYTEGADEKTLTFDKGTDYTVQEDARGYKVDFTEAGLKKVTDAAKFSAVTLNFAYSAMLNRDTPVEVPQANDVIFYYGHKPQVKSEPKTGNPKDKKISVEKSWDRDGDNKTTEADANAIVTYTLYEQKGNDWEEVKSVTVGAKEQFKYTFTDLDDNKTYKVVERVAGYEPEYVSFENGVVKITNKGDKDNPKPLNPSEPKVVTYGKRFIKINNVDFNNDGTQEKVERLFGAEFVIKNDGGEFLAYLDDAEKAKADEKIKTAKETLDKAVETYNKLEKDKQTDEEKQKVTAAQDAYNKAVLAKTEYKWVKKQEDAIKFVSDNEGKFEVKGLDKGSYTLVETAAPEGYANNNNTYTFVVDEGTYNGTAAEMKYEKEIKDGETQHYGQQIKNKKVSIPQTGGIGTLVFALAGISLMGGAAYAMKKNKVEDQ